MVLFLLPFTSKNASTNLSCFPSGNSFGATKERREYSYSIIIIEVVIN
jgi:hypothetical protein